MIRVLLQSIHADVLEVAIHPGALCNVGGLQHNDTRIIDWYIVRTSNSQKG